MCIFDELRAVSTVKCLINVFHSESQCPVDGELSHRQITLVTLKKIKGMRKFQGGNKSDRLQ